MKFRLPASFVNSSAAIHSTDEKFPDASGKEKWLVRTNVIKLR